MDGGPGDHVRDGLEARCGARSAMAYGEIEQHDVEAVNSTERRQLYKKREPIYPKLVHGKYRAIKWAILAVTLGIYYGLPWIRWPRGAHEPSQAVLADFEGQRFYFFFIEIWPDELYFLTGLLVLSALALFLVTALFGRLWCGYACPQTVWTDLFVAVERLIEGDRNKRIKLAAAPWTAEKVAKKVSKHAIWLLIAAATGGAWVLYFHDAPTVVRGLFTGAAPGSAYLFLGVLTFTTYSLAGIMREQVCIYMCPWPRIQAAMTDADTFAVGYVKARGEPRGRHKKGETWEGRGDCVDCKACVAACPMGIDIRDGDQLECINCGLCIDACDDIMKKVGRPTGLVSYGAEYRLETAPEKRRVFPRFVRTRTVFYGGVVALISLVMIVGLASRSTMEFTLERSRAPAYTRLSDGSVRNALVARVVNKNAERRDYEIVFAGPEGLDVSAVGLDVSGATVTLPAAADEPTRARLFLTLPAAAAAAPDRRIEVVLRDPVTGETMERSIEFVSGGR